MNKNVCIQKKKKKFYHLSNISPSTGHAKKKKGTITNYKVIVDGFMNSLPGKKVKAAISPSTERPKVLLQYQRRYGIEILHRMLWIWPRYCSSSLVNNNQWVSAENYE